MNISKIKIIILLPSILFLLGMKIYKPFEKQNFKEIEVFNINKKKTDLKVKISLNISENTLEFYSTQNITKISLFDFSGKKIDNTILENTISLENLEDNKYYLSFISNDRYSLKTIYLN